MDNMTPPKSKNQAPYGWKTGECFRCGGDGTRANEQPCAACDGTGKLEYPMTAGECVAALRAERDTLKTALEAIRDYAPAEPTERNKVTHYKYGWQRVRDMARAALDGAQ